MESNGEVGWKLIIAEFCADRTDLKEAEINERKQGKKDGRMGEWKKEEWKERKNE